MVLVADHLGTKLVVDALDMACWRRKPDPNTGLIHHADHGTQPRFKESLQHRLVGWSVEARQGLRQVFSIRGSYEVDR